MMKILLQDYKLYIDLLKAGKELKQLNKVLYELNTEDNISTKHKKSKILCWFTEEIKNQLTNS